MRVNVEKVLERDQKLSELDNRAGNFFNTLISMPIRSGRPSATFSDTQRILAAKQQTTSIQRTWFCSIIKLMSSEKGPDKYIVFPDCQLVRLDRRCYLRLCLL